MRRMYDAAYPPAAPPAWEVVAGYIGGDTPHVWTAAEWAAQPARYRLPIWTRDNPAGYNGTTEGQAAAAAVRSLGMPAGTAIALDFEQAVDAGYLGAFDAAVRAAGHTCIVYGSESSVLQNPRPSAGYWVANWNTPSNPFLDPRSNATQYASYSQLGTAYDASLVSDALVLWDTRPPKPPVPPPPPDLLEDEMPLLMYVGKDPATGTSPGVYLLSGNLYIHVPTPDDVGSLQAAGVKHASIEIALHNALVANANK